MASVPILNADRDTVDEQYHTREAPSYWCLNEDCWIASSYVYPPRTPTDNAEGHMWPLVCWSHILVCHVIRVQMWAKSCCSVNSMRSADQHCVGLQVFYVMLCCTVLHHCSTHCRL